MEKSEFNYLVSFVIEKNRIKNAIYIKEYEVIWQLF